ncbi:MAG TPA: PKD domain-containing protein [Mycobacteriales bacterium]|jgi:hypothetical protein|nr:PKD domain-containing protein [Mycobacteriales bacterium]
MTVDAKETAAGQADFGPDFGSLEAASYQPTDSYFGAPYIDIDEWRESPAPHRHVHGGFANTDTRFTFYFPPPDLYEGRMLSPLEGAHGGHEDAFGGPMGAMIGGLDLTIRLGGYLSESNQGHIGDDVDPRAGDDPTIYGYRANTEAGRFSRHVAAQVYGEAPHHSYVWGGSGGGRRSPLNLEYGADIWDGAMPFMGGGDIDDHGTTKHVQGAQVMSFAAMFNVQRIMRDRISSVVDATAAGGSGDPYAGLTTHEREELANLYRLGYPRGDEFMIGQPMGQIWLWTSMASELQEVDADYFESFWTKPGYVGHDAPHLVADDVIDFTGEVSRVITPRVFLENPEDFPDEQFAMMKLMVSLLAGTNGMDLPVAVEIKGIGGGYRLGAGVKVVSGKAAGRQLYALNTVGDVFQCDGVGEANLERFTGVEVGDTVHVDNRPFLAFCYYYRHHLMDDPQFDFLRVDGVPIYQQHPVPLQSPLMGTPYSGKYEGKLLWIHHTHDASLWPPQGMVYREAVRRAQGEQGLEERFRQRWSQNAEHIPVMFAPSDPKRATSTWLIDYMPLIEQGLVDLLAWCEQGVVPAATSYSYADGKVSLPATAAERGGVQPVVTVTANGGSRAEVKVGESVVVTAIAEAPPAGGTITGLEWDLEGSGAFGKREEIDGKSARVECSTTHTYDKPGTYFVTARVTGNCDSDAATSLRQLPNLASARVVVA